MKQVSALFLIITLCLIIVALPASEMDAGVLPNNSETDGIADSDNMLGPEDEADGDELRESTFTFIDIDENTCTLSKAVCVNENIFIPETSPEGRTVTEIGGEAFKDCKNIKSVVIPDTVTHIGKSAFEYCIALEKITMGDGISEIDEDAFFGCESLQEVYIDSLDKWCYIDFSNIYSNPVAYSKHLKMTHDSESKSDIDQNTHKLYLNGNPIADLVIPDGIGNIKAYSFVCYDSITGITLSQSVQKIGYGAFAYCSELVNIEVTDNLKIIDSYSFYGCTALKNSPNFDHVKRIGSYAFAGCLSLECLNISKNIESVGEYAFTNCVSLRELTVENGNQVIDASAFEKCKNIQMMSVSSDLLRIIKHDNIVELNVTKGSDIKPEECYFDTLLQKVVIGEGIESIGNGTFKGCTSLEEITLPRSMTKIGMNAFEYCKKLKTVNYAGSEEEWNQINGIDEIPDNVKINFNFTSN